MSALRALQYVLWTMLALAILAPVLLATPVGGLGSLPLFGGEIFWAMMFFPILLPILILLLVATIIISSNDRTTDGVMDNKTRTAQPRPSGHHSQRVGQPVPDETLGIPPTEILRERYANGDISHEEYETRLQILLDTEGSDDLRDRIEWTDEQESR